VDRAKKITKNTIWVLTARGIDILSNLILMAIIARYLGVEGFGVFSVLMAIVWAISPFLILGLPRILARDIAQNKNKINELIGRAITLIGLAAIPFLVIIPLFVFMFKITPGNTVIILIITLLLIITAITRTLSSILVAFEKMHYEAIVSLLLALTSLFFIGVVVCIDLGFIFIFVGLLISNISSLVGYIFISYRHFALIPKFGIEKDTLAYLVKESTPMLTYQLLMQAHLYSGVFLLKLLSSNLDVGLFHAPYRIINRLQIIPLTAVVGMYPHLSQLAISDKDRLRSTVLTVLKLTLFASLPLTIFIFIFADKITWLIFGEAFSRSTIALQIQILGLTLLFLLSIFESLFVILKRQHQLIVVVGSGLFLSLILNIILAPRYGYVGASLITLISGIVMFIVSVHMLSDFFEGYSLIKVMYRPILAASVTTFVLYVIPAFHNMVLASVGLLIIFILMLFILNAFSHKEILFMKAVGQKLRWNNITNSNI